MRNFGDDGTVPLIVEEAQMVRLAACGTCHNYALTGTPEKIHEFKTAIGRSIRNMKMLNAYLWFREVHPQRLKHDKGSDEGWPT